MCGKERLEWHASQARAICGNGAMFIHAISSAYGSFEIGQAEVLHWGGCHVPEAAVGGEGTIAAFFFVQERENELSEHRGRNT